MLKRYLLKQKKSGYVLLEIIIYVAIFSILIGGLIATSFLLIQNSGKTSSRVVTEEEVNFILKKFDWVLTGASNLSVSVDKKTVTVVNTYVSANPVKIEHDEVNQKVKLGGTYISTVNVHVTSLLFEEMSGSPKGLKIDLAVDGQTVTRVVYLKI